MRLDGAFAAAGSLRRYLGEHEPHAHAHAQVLFGIEGCLDLEVEGRGARVDACAGLIVPAGARHGFEAGATAHVWVIDAPAAPGLEGMRAFALPPGWSTRADPSDLLGIACGASRVLPRRRLDAARLEAAIAARLHEPWPTQRMAAVFALSVPRFHARWLELTRSTPQCWLRRRRLARAEVLLRAGVGLEAAALQVAYRSGSALLFALSRDRGVTTRSLRQR
jgi:AraC-like DNA-binding protein